MNTQTTPLFSQLVQFVKENRLNVQEMYNPQDNDVNDIVFDAETFTDEHYDEMVAVWQQHTPATLAERDAITTEMLQNCFNKMNAVRGTERFWVLTNVADRIIRYRLNLLQNA